MKKILLLIAASIMTMNLFAANDSNLNAAFQPRSDRYFFGGTIDSHGNQKDPFLAGLMSFVVPGLGQFYNGDTIGGCVFLGVNVALNLYIMNTTAAINTADANGDTATINALSGQLLASLAGSLTWNILSICNASKTAKKVSAVRGFALGGGKYLRVDPYVCNGIANDYTLLQSNGSNLCCGMSMTLTF